MITKKQLIDALIKLDLSDDTPVVVASSIGFEDIYNVRTGKIMSSFSKSNEEFEAIILD